MKNPGPTKSDRSKHVVIIGAGIVGISAGIWLQRAGHRVTVIDRIGPAGGTSYGNAGVLAAAAIVPITVPGLLTKAPGMLLNRDFPLFLRWSYLPRLVPFLLKYLLNANDAGVARISKDLDLLLHDTVEQHQALAKGTRAAKYLHTDDYLFGYATKAAFDADAYSWNVRREHGVDFEPMDKKRLAEFDPVLAKRFGYAVRCPNHGRISDPGAYVNALADHLWENGGKFINEEVVDIQSYEGTATQITTSEQIITCDEIVLAAGVWSSALTKKLGLSVPMESERGYHIEFVNPSFMPKSPIMVASGKFVITPMKGRLRCAGIVEFGGLTPKHSRAPLELLKRQTARLLPDLQYDRIDEWMGHRPSTADSLPMIGSVTNRPNLWTAFGHQHIGLTAGPKTGHWIAQLISGETPNVNLDAFDPNRF